MYDFTEINIYNTKKMKPSESKLAHLGAFIDDTRRQMHINKELLCDDVQCSKSTYCKV